MKKALPLIVVIVLIAGTLVLVWAFTKDKPSSIQTVTVTNFEECVAAGNSVMESYPRKCSHNGVTYTENIGNELEKSNLIRIDSPRPNESIQSPLSITGEARGNWFFEASFPITIKDENGQVIVQSFATAQGEWMTTEFVPYKAKITFSVEQNMVGKKGTLVLQKDNPSGLPEHDDSLEIPIVFGQASANGSGLNPVPPLTACTQEALLCSDGSYVGRTGPNCEFASCPIL